MVHLSFRAKQGLSIHETSHSSQQLPDVCHNISSIMCVAGQHHARVPRIPGHVRAGLLPATRDTAAHVAPYYQLQLPVSLASQVPPWTRPAASQLLQHWREAETFQHSFTLALLQVCSSALVSPLLAHHSHNVARTCSTPRCPGSAPPWWRWPRWPGTRVSAGAVNGSSRNFGIILCYLGI